MGVIWIIVKDVGMLKRIIMIIIVIIIIITLFKCHVFSIVVLI